MFWKWLIEDLVFIAWLAGDPDWKVVIRGYLAGLFTFIALWVTITMVIMAGHWASEWLIQALEL